MMITTDSVKDLEYSQNRLSLLNNTMISHKDEISVVAPDKGQNGGISVANAEKYPHIEKALLNQAIKNLSSVMIQAEQREVNPEVFSDIAHMSIWRILQQAFREDRKMDFALLVQELSSKGDKEDKKKLLAALLQIQQTSATEDAVPEYLNKLKDAKLVRDSQDAIQKWQKDNIGTGKPAENVQSLISTLSTTLEAQNKNFVSVPMKDSLHEVVAEMQRQMTLGTHIKGIRTGYPILDDAIGGMSGGGGYYLAAGRPGDGKTSFGLNVALNVASDKENGNGTVLIVSGEMSIRAMCQRLLSMTSKMSWQRLCHPPEEQFERIQNAIDNLMGYNIAILPASESAEVTANKVRFLCRTETICLVVVDYLQLFRSEMSSKGSRVDDLERVSAIFRELAKSINVPILALAQLNRGADRTVDKRPTMADLKGSGALEQDAQAVMLIHHIETYEKDERKQDTGKTPVELILAKNRDGETGVIPFLWEGSTQIFSEMAPRI